jgi:hypothetical protein
MTYKISYDPQTTLVLGKYPSKLYENAPEPNIEISDSEYKRIFGAGLFRQPCVVNGVIQEFQRPAEELLQEAKTAKITQLKLNRDTHNLSPMVAVQANEITFDKSGFDVITDKKVYFRFLVTPTNQPGSEPTFIILSQSQAKNPDSYRRYSCAIIEENLVREGYVAINKAVALTLDEHIAERYTNAIKYTNDIEDKINACTTIEEVNAINITFE